MSTKAHTSTADGIAAKVSAEVGRRSLGVAETRP